MNTIQDCEGGSLLLEKLGSPPNFSDADVRYFTLRVDDTVSFAEFSVTVPVESSVSLVVTIRLDDIQGCDVRGLDVQGIVQEAVIEFADSGVSLTIKPMVGLAGSISAHRMSFDVREL